MFATVFTAITPPDTAAASILIFVSMTYYAHDCNVFTGGMVIVFMMTVIILITVIMMMTISSNVFRLS